MFQLMINEKGGQSTAQSFDKNEITIGRVQGNDIVLPKGNISKRHSRIVLKDGKFIIVDLKSTNGTYVNGKKITAPQVIKATDKIYIGDYTLQLTNGGGAAAPAPEARDMSKAGAKAKADEVDLFGDQPASEPSDGPAKAGSPGLIDENFDQEFDVGQDAPPKKGAAPAPAAGAKSRLPAAKAPEPEPPPDDEGDQELDLGSDFPGDRDNGAQEADAEPEPPKAPVVQMKPSKAKAAPVVTPPASPAPRAQPSKVKPATPVAARGKAAPAEDDFDGGFGDVEPQPESTPSLGQAPAEKRPAPVLSLPSSSPPASSAPQVIVPPPPPQMGGAVMAVAGGEKALDRYQALRALHHAIVGELNLRSFDLGSLASMKERATQTAKTLLQRWQATGKVSAQEDLENLARAAAMRAVDLDLVIDLFQDDEVLQIAVTPDRQIWAEREAFKPEGRIISSEDQVIDLIARLGVLGGADPGPDSPLVDVRLRDGSRVVACLPPLAFRGPTLSIRKATRDWYNFESFIESSTISEGMMKFLDFCIRTKRNLLLSLGPGVSGSATLNAIVSQFADDERVVTVESGVELHLGNLKNATAFEPSEDRPLTQLIKHATMMLPDRVIVGNLTGEGVFDVLTAYSGPLDGSVAAYFASSPQQALDRLSGDISLKLPEAAAKKLVASAFPVILQEHRFPEGGSRRITHISEVVMEGDDVSLHDIFVFRPEGVDENGIITGTFAPTGHEPSFVRELVERGDEIDMEIFKE